MRQSKAKPALVKDDGFVKNPISALRFIPLSLRRTARKPHSTGFARLELGLFTKLSGMMTFYGSIKDNSLDRPFFCGAAHRRPNPDRSGNLPFR
jgi:hypothetical protein